MPVRLFALVKKEPGLPPSRHFVGMPPELTGCKDYRQRLPMARVLLLQEENDGISLYRYAQNGGLAGDTWHETIRDAMEQAEDEYGDALGEWKPVPDDVDDADEFVIGQIP